MRRKPDQNPRTRILNSAEAAFADAGYNGTSIREIVRVARVNLALAYYYFGSKRGLMEAVLLRRFGPLRQEHLGILSQFEREAKGQPLPVEKILEAMLLPPLRLFAAPVARRHAVTRLLGRIISEPDELTQDILRRQRSEVRSAFLRALRASLPRATPAALQWHMEFVWGALAFILCDPRKIAVETHGACNPVDADNLLREMIGFFSAGFRSAVTPKRRAAISAIQRSFSQFDQAGPTDRRRFGSNPSGVRPYQRSPRGSVSPSGGMIASKRT